MRGLTAFALCAALVAMAFATARTEPVPTEAIVVIAHRGDKESAPENTLPAIEAAIEIGADYVEIDVRTTADGELVVIHNSTVDQRTDGNGRVREMTFAEIRSLDAGSWYDSSFAGTKIPTAEEAMLCAKGRINVFLEVKAASPEDIVALLDSTDMFESTIVYDGTAALKEMRALDPRVRAMVPRPPADLSQLPALMEELAPTHFCHSTKIKPPATTPEVTAEIVEACHNVGAKVYVNVMHNDTPEGWEYALSTGADGLETDRAAACIAFLEERGLRD